MAKPLIEINIKGLKELQDKLRKLGEAEFRSGMHRATLAGALIVRDAARELLSTPGPPRSEPREPPHIDTGALRAAVITMRRRKDPNPSPYVAQYTVTVLNGKLTKIAKRRFTTSKGSKGGYKRPAGPAVYARFLEYGTSRMKAPRPFMTPAYENNKELVLQTMKEKLRAAIKKAMAR